MNPLPRQLAALSTLIAACVLGLPGWAGTADIANVPLGTNAVRPKPNVMFILDDSGSMDSNYMPDEMSNSGRYGYYSSQCNGVAYNPAVIYNPPVDYQGTAYPNATFTNAWRDGYNTGGSKTNLSTAVTDSTYYRYTGSQPAMGWVFLANGSVDTGSTFYSECMTSIGSTAPFTAVRVTSASTDAQNYANWFAYYRTRMNLMRTATGRAFSTLDSNYRVGFTVISDPTASGSHFLDIADFASGAGGQRAQFYDKLYTVFNQDYTPLRGALSKIGQYYGNVAPGQTTDPIQYSCQRNYAILSTDGYWNTNIETNSYGPYALDGSSVGQQDVDENRPMKDSGTYTVTTTTGTRRTDRKTYEGTASLTGGKLRRVSTQITSSGCSGGKKKAITLTQQANATYQAPRSRVEDVVVTVTRVVVTVNGTQTSDNTTTANGTATLVSDTLGDSTLTATGSWGTVSGTTVTGSCSSSETRPTGTTYSDPVAYSSPTTTSWLGGTPTPSVSQGTSVAYPSVPLVVPSGTGGSSNSLADVAEYYWKTDLRTGMNDDVAQVSGDSNTKQHMNTFTVGLGVKGTLTYDSAYLTQTAGDYVDLKSGAKNWPNPGAGATKIDDLWHAAVNGRGQYFSATDPTSLASAIATTLARITEQTGAGAAAAASTLTPTQGDDWIFLPSYTYNPEANSSWFGDLRAFKFIIDSISGTITVPDTSAGNEVWSAKNLLDARSTARNIYFKSGSTLTALTYANLSSASLNSSFDNRCTTASILLAQCATMAATPKAKVTGTNLVDYLRGDTSLYLNASDANNRVFRNRTSRLGDFVNASPVYVGKPPFKYADSGYASFESTHTTRTKVVYAGANDGMLHAFKVGTGSGDATGGTELWAYVPTAVIPDLWRLADSAYDANHRYFVDATPVVADIYDGTQWRTILVGGLGAGGRSYYALDITTPETPSLLWEITSSSSGFENLGLSYGNPIVTKNSAGTWIVAFTSGLNNVSGGDGVGRLYIVNAATGAKISEVSTGAGSTATPSNLSRIDGWVDTTTNNTVLRFYGGDMLGNVWRFDHDNRYLPTGAEALLMGTAQTSGGTGQPITSKPVLTELTNGASTVPVIAFGTGRYLGTTDLSDSTRQGVYALKDAQDGNTLCGTATGPCNLRSTDAKLVRQSLNSSRVIPAPASVNWATQNGWFVDLDQSSGERIFLDGVPLSAGVLAFASSVPGNSVCAPGGTSYLYQFSLNRGTVLDVRNYNTMIVGLGRVMDSAGNVSAIVTRQDQRLEQQASGTTSPGAGATVRRSSWRELID
jgi:type IV pilus assembly protein PilY1